MTLRIVGMTCAVGADVGLEAFARRIYAGTGGMRSQQRPVSLQTLVTELGQDVVVAGPELPRIGGIVLGTAVNPVDEGEGSLSVALSDRAVPALQRTVDIPVVHADSRDLVQALGLAARWLGERTLDLVVLGSESPGCSAAVLLAADPATREGSTTTKGPAYACITGSVEPSHRNGSEDFQQALSQMGLTACDIGLLTSDTWPPASAIVDDYRDGLRVVSGDHTASHDASGEGAGRRRTQEESELSCAVSAADDRGSAAPLLSLIQAALCIDRRMWVPGPSEGTVDSPAMELEAAWSETPFFSVTEARPWLVPVMSRRVADVAYVTEGGAAHVFLVEPKSDQHVPVIRPDLVTPRSHLIPVVGDTVGTVVAALGDVRIALSSGVDVETIAAQHCRALTEPPSETCVLALVARNRQELLKEIEHAEEGLAKAVVSGKEWQTPLGSTFAPVPLGTDGVTFVYPGVFNSYPGLARDLFQHFPWLHDALGEITTDPGAVLAERWLYPRRRGGVTQDDLRSQMLRLQDCPEAMIESGATVAIAHTHVMQDVFGVQARAALGYSMGEVSMLWATGVWQDAEAGSRTLHASPLFREVISGPKLAVKAHWELDQAEAVDWATYLLKAKVDHVREAVAQEARVYITFVNLDNEVVIAGEATACARVVEHLKCHALPVPASVAIHNEAIDAAYDDFVALYTHPVSARPELTFYSAADYGPVRLEEEALADAMATMCCQPVDFPRLISRAYDDGARLFLELGPLGTCTRRIKRILRGDPHAAVAVNPTPGEDLDGFVRALAVLVAHHVPVTLSPLYDEVPRPGVEVISPVIERPLRVSQATSKASVDVMEERAVPSAPVTESIAVEPIADGLVSSASVERAVVRRTDPAPSKPAVTAFERRTATSPTNDAAQSRVSSNLIDLYGRQLLPQQNRAAEMHRAFLADRDSAQSRASTIIELQMAAARRLLGVADDGDSRRVDPNGVPQREIASSRPARASRSLEQKPSVGPKPEANLTLEADGEGLPVGAPGHSVKPLFDEAALREFAAGDVTRCFGSDFAIYRGRRLPRIPNGDLLMMSRITDIQGDPAVLSSQSRERRDGELDAMATLRSEFDVEPGAWFYQNGTADRRTIYPGLPPYVVLMEMALQPCGFLSAYLRSSLLEPERNLYFRNLDGRGRILADVDLRGKTVHDDVRLLTSTRGQGVIIQTYAFSLSCEGTPFYEGWSSFGYFPLPALQRQVGLDIVGSAEEDTAQATPSSVQLIGTEGAGVPEQIELYSELRVVPTAATGALPTLLVHGDVTPEDWYFGNHFYQDPVMPGSLGVETAMQAMLQYARWRYPALAGDVRQAVGQEMVWKYRGQITPEDVHWREAIELTEVRRDAQGVTVVGDVTLWKGDIPIYRIEGAAVRMGAQD